MNLITIGGDVFVAADVQAILTDFEGKSIRVVLRGRAEAYDYDFDSEKETRDVARAAVKILASTEALPSPPTMTVERSVPAAE